MIFFLFVSDQENIILNPQLYLVSTLLFADTKHYKTINNNNSEGNKKTISLFVQRIANNYVIEPLCK